MAANFTSTPTTTELVQNAQAQLTQFALVLNNLNLARASLSLAAVTTNPTVAAMTTTLATWDYS